MNYIQLLKTISLSYYRKEKSSCLIAILGMIISIALYSSIRLANLTAINSFNESITKVSGTDTLSIRKYSGKISDEVFKILLTIDGIESISPYSSKFISKTTKSSEFIQIIGVDIFSSAPLLFREREIPRDNILSLLKNKTSGILLSNDSIKNEGSLVEPLEEISVLIDGKEKKINITYVLTKDTNLKLASNSPTIILDISKYQELFSELGVIDSFVILTDEKIQFEDLEKKIISSLGDDYYLSTSSTLRSSALDVSAGFRLNLLFLSGISVLLSILLIYNLSSFHVLKRRKDFGTMLSIGSRRNSIFFLLLSESIVLGVISGSFGSILGYFFSFFSTELVTRTFSLLYYPIPTASPNLTLSLIIECFILGIAGSIFGTLFPALEVFRIPLRESFGYQTFEEKFQKKIKYLTLLSAFCLLLSYLLSKAELLDSSIYLGFLPSLFLIISSILFSAFFIKSSIYLIRKLAEFLNSAPLLLSSDHISQTLRRYSISLSSIVVAITMGLGLSIMIGSFRSSVETWITKVTYADLYLSTIKELSASNVSFIPNEIIDFLKNMPEVNEIDWALSESITLNNKKVKVLGNRFEVLKKHPRLLFTKTNLDENTLLKNINNNSALISESLMNKHKLSLGDSIKVSGVNYDKSFIIDGVYKDYSGEHGVLTISDKSFRELFEHDKKEAVSLYLNKREDIEYVRERIKSEFPNYFIEIRNNLELRSEVLGIFDQTFLITKGIRFMIAVLAIFILAMCVQMLLIERKREFSILHAIGASRNIIIRSIVYESLIIAFLGSILGVIFGILLSLLLVFNVNAFFFGWSLEYVLNLNELLFTSFLVILCSIGASYLVIFSSKLDFNSSDIRYA